MHSPLFFSSVYLVNKTKSYSNTVHEERKAPVTLSKSEKAKTLKYWQWLRVLYLTSEATVMARLMKPSALHRHRHRQ